MKKLKTLSILLINCLALSCMNENYKLDKIEKLSNVIIPTHSEILIYNNDLDLEIAFKIHIEKNELHTFLEKYEFNQVDTLKRDLLSKSTTDKYLIYNIENGFIPREKIYGNDLRILKSKSGTFVVNVENSILWGLINK